MDEAIIQHQHAGNTVEPGAAGMLDVDTLVAMLRAVWNVIALPRMKDILQRQRNPLDLDLALGVGSRHITPAVGKLRLDRYWQNCAAGAGGTGVEMSIVILPSPWSVKPLYGSKSLFFVPAHPAEVIE